MADQLSPDLHTPTNEPHGDVGRLHRLSLIKGPQRWSFQWACGDESALINAIAAFARDPQIDFDWYDAAIVCKHIAQPFHPAHSDQSHPNT
jgi:hypothetical protein